MKLIILLISVFLRRRKRKVSTSRHIPASVRRYVLWRDGEHCRFCGRRVSKNAKGNNKLHFHHIVPFTYFTPSVVDSLGSPHQASNICVACKRCNLSIGSRFGVWPGRAPQPKILDIILELLKDAYSRTRYCIRCPTTRYKAKNSEYEYAKLR